jgi:hypothetical protein
MNIGTSAGMIGKKPCNWSKTGASKRVLTAAIYCKATIAPSVSCLTGLTDWTSAEVRSGQGGRLVAFSLGSLVDDEMAVIHFEKADTAIPGLYAAINKMVLEHAFPQARFVNREEDMGIPGLRKSKESYNPLRMIHKYEAFLQKCD